ncbi:MAG: tetratricopeptide repeat protein [Phycisphaerae bacterium]|jgi:tetratricopeptide (TPR) repeat protein
MSFLLETLGRGLLGRLTDAFRCHWPRETGPLRDLVRMHEYMPTSLDIALRLGVACLREMQLADARAAFEAALRLDPKAVQALLGLACVFDERGRLDEALRCLREAEQLDNTDPAVAFAVAFCHERLGDDGEAARGYERASELCPTLRNALERRGALAVRAADWPAAAAHYRALHELDPQNMDVLLGLAAIELQRDEHESAVDLFQRAVLVEPQADERMFGRSDELETESTLAGAIAHGEQLVSQYPGLPEFHLQLGDLYVKSGDDSAAVREYRAALAVQPDLLEANIKLGTQHLRMRRYFDAAESFNRAAELNDRLLAAFVGLGVAQRAAGREDDAWGSFDLAVSLAPNSTLLFAETTRLHSKAWRLNRESAGDGGSLTALECADSDDDLLGVLEHYEESARAHAACAELPYRLGLLRRQVGEFDEAIEALRAATRINPVYCKPLIKLGVSLREAGRNDEALECFERAMRLNADGVEVHYQLGLLFAQRNQFDMLVERFELEQDDRRLDLPLRQNLLLALQNIGMVDRAAAAWDLLCEMTRERLDAADALECGDSRISPRGRRMR